MDKQIIPTTIPLSPSLINDYCRGNAAGAQNIIFEFDISESSLTPAHILGYLANLKIDFQITGFDSKFFLEYLRTPFLVGDSNLVRLHANMLTWRTQLVLEFETLFEHTALYESIPDEVIWEQMMLLNSLPLFLIESSDAPGPIKNPLVGETQDEDDTIFDNVGVNFVHLIKGDQFLLKLISPTLLDLKSKKYYTHYFDKYIYSGDKLIQFFIDSPNNLLTTAINSMLSR